ncbi:adenylate/guanylate cyclase domain-containing protein [Ekhidna sp.]|uniref:adenylate/guanylate cyclase domain-containing protein n=1 Tax=Ekhidna sp. TaxID=2608089 RepID=UPI003CCBA5D6
MKISPKAKRNLNRIIPFGLIWLLSGWVFLLTEFVATRNQSGSSETEIELTLPVFIFASIAITIIGLFVGTLEMVYLEKRFRKHSLRGKIFYKFLIYFILFLVIIAVNYPIAASLEQGVSIISSDVWERTGKFFQSITFLNTLFQLSLSLFVSLIYAAISENLGHQVFINFFTGKYHKPTVETRIFMFLDMKSSTTIAESLGHVRYFKLLQEYYDLMSDPIVSCQGEVYQYIGDEIVVSWKLEKGLANANCVNCFFEIQEQLKDRRDYLLNEYGFEVGFKAGMHYGEVTIGEVGALKKEIVFTGDVLNTTARIQSQCNDLNSDLLVSGKLKEALSRHSYEFNSRGAIELRGKDKKIELFSVTA